MATVALHPPSRKEGFRPLVARNLRQELASILSEEVVSGRLAPGSRLPTEQELMASFGVSRTVVREAIAALRSEGLLESRQGVGVFVARDVLRRPFRIDPERLKEPAEVVKLMEMRRAIEVESAGLAAERRGAAGLKKIRSALQAIQATLRRGETAIEPDFAFHSAIAEATGNEYCVSLLGFLGRFIIRHQSLRIETLPDGAREGHLEVVQNEHRRIYEAIARGDAEAAREAMRRHLRRSLEQYRQASERSAAAS
jgi:DNA-binding FadR family transcriptional regulator